MRTSALLSLLFFVLTACGSPDASPGANGPASSGIIGGAPVAEGDALGRSVVMVGQSGFADCSATLISENLVVTAAHCVDPLFRGETKAEDFFVKFRSPGLPVDDRPVSAFRIHPLWFETLPAMREALLPRLLDPTWRNWGDLALVKFSGGLPMGYAPAEIGGAELALAPGDAIVLAGFGSQAHEANPADESGVLRRVEVNVAELSADSLEFLVRQENGKGSCKGDSGGPAFLERDGRTELIGVISRAVGPVENTVVKLCRHGSLYSDLRRVAPWLRSAADELNRDGPAN